jgi:hypothetical protein
MKKLDQHFEKKTCTNIYLDKMYNPIFFQNDFSNFCHKIINVSIFCLKQHIFLLPATSDGSKSAGREDTRGGTSSPAPSERGGADVGKLVGGAR